MRVLSGDADIGENILREIEQAGGTRPHGCPWSALADPYVQAVIGAYRWNEKGTLAQRWGIDPPHALMLGIETVGRAMTAIENHDLQKKRDEDRAKRDAPNPQASPRGRRPALPRHR